MTIKVEVKNRITGLVQFTAEIECDEDAPVSLKLGLAVKWAIKNGVNLRGADLSGVDLSAADLSGTYLGGKKLAPGLSFALLGTPDSWSALTYFTETGQQRVSVGCRDFTLAEGRKYWSGKETRREVMAALDYAEAIAKIRGWAKAKEAAHD